MSKTGVVPETPIWCSAGYYKSARDLSKETDRFLTDSFNIEDNIYCMQLGNMVRIDEAKLVKVVYKKESKFESQQQTTEVVCAEDTEFLVSLENSHQPCYCNDTLYFIKAKDLKAGTRLWAEELCLTVEKVEPLNSVGTVYSFSPSDSDCEVFSIEFGAFIKVYNEKQLDDIEYAFTVKGGGWSYIHELFVICKDGTVARAREFDDSNILNYVEDFRFNYKNTGVDEDTTAISICNGKKTYLSSILKGEEPNFEKHSKGHFVFDAPTYTMYKVKNGVVKKLFSTEDVNSCKAMNYIETLCSVLRRRG